MKQDETKNTTKKSAGKNKGGLPPNKYRLLDTKPERIDTMLNLLASGLPVNLACEYSGISQGTYYKYMNQAEDDIAAGKTAGNSAYVKFFKNVNHAQSQIMKYCFEIMKAHTPTDWRAADALLTRMRPDIYGKKEIVTNNFNEKVIIKQDIPKKPKGD